MGTFEKGGSKKTKSAKGSKTEEVSNSPEFTSELAMEIVGELYPLLLENCTDEDDAVDTTAVMESLAALVGLFATDYHEQYGQKKSMDMVKAMVDLALQLYRERTAEEDE